MIQIIVLDEFGEQSASFGKFNINDIQTIIDKAEKENMSCLAFVDILQDTYFNDIQCRDIKKEIETLKQYENLNPELMLTIQKAVNKALVEEEYIKFEGI